MFRTPADVTRISVRTHMRAVKGETRHMPNDPHLLGVLITTTGVGLAMTWLAARLSLIELRKPNRCPACGRERVAGSCGCSA
jgi:hypothetical protein